MSHAQLSRRNGASVFAQLPFWRHGTVEQRTKFALAVHQAAMRAEKNVASLRRHPDLAARFVRELGYERLDQWDGYCPPSRNHDGFDIPRLNASPRRAAIVEILMEAASRDKGTSGDA